MPKPGTSAPESPGTGVRVARNAGLLAGATAAARLLTFVLGVVIARGLGPRDDGRYGLAVALATMLLPLADLGTTPYLSHEAARDRSFADQVAKRLFLTRTATSVAVAVLAVVGTAVVLRDDALVAAVGLVLLATLADGTSQFAFGYFQGRERMGYEALATAGAAFLRAVGGIALVVVTGELLPVLLWVLAVSGIQVLLAVLRLRSAVQEREVVPAPAAPSWPSVLSMGMIAVFVMVYLRADTVMIGWLLDERQAGLYTAGYTIMASLQIVPWMVALALTPVFARSFGKDDRLFRTSWSEGLRTVLVISLPLALVTAILAAPMVDRVFGAAYGPSADALAIIVWSCPIASLNVLMAAVMRGAGREGSLTAASGVGAAINVGLNLAVIPVFGIAGAAGTTIAAEVVVFAGLSVIAYRNGLLPPLRLPILRFAAALGALAAATSLSDALPVELRVLLGFAAYGAAAAATGIVGRDDVDRLLKVVPRS